MKYRSTQRSRENHKPLWHGLTVVPALCRECCACTKGQWQLDCALSIFRAVCCLPENCLSSLAGLWGVGGLQTTACDTVQET